jgi:hypothetical protein
MVMELVIELLFLFGIKHFFADFVWQTPWMLSQKGTYGASGGLAHAGMHSLGTFVVLVAVFPWGVWSHAAAAMLAVLDGVVHYHIDWAKTNLSRGLTPADQKFWCWFGLDQTLHYLTYVAIIGIIVL